MVSSQCSLPSLMADNTLKTIVEDDSKKAPPVIMEVPVVDESKLELLRTHNDELESEIAELRIKFRDFEERIAEFRTRFFGNKL
ncbi:hypothetical protein QQ045_012350 [Rhodiola kirilowii]